MFLAALPAIGERIDHDVIEQEQANAYADGDEQIFFAIFSFMSGSLFGWRIVGNSFRDDGRVRESGGGGARIHLIG